MAEPLERDIEVLQHLRGYPEELHRFANRMKQTNPRGMSAALFLLNRAGAQDGFLETISRSVAAGESVLTAVEAAEAAGVRPQAFLDDLASRADFPTPIFRQDHRALWRKADIERYLQSHPAPAAPSPAGPPDQ
ncbi:MAG TPA: hypothetical protein VNA31_08955 [bacterium]|nr:hypothetical protein [bacterium]